MKYEILDAAKLADNYAMYGWVVVCDGDTLSIVCEEP